MVPGSLGCGVVVFAATTTLAPSFAARSAIARPMPRDAPVMKSVLFFRLISIEGDRMLGDGRVRGRCHSDRNRRSIDPPGRGRAVHRDDVARGETIGALDATGRVTG